ncbi:MAG: aldehyde dehydrogenase family protein [Pigmentiphaga sp.]
MNLLKDAALWRAAALIDGTWIESTTHGAYTLNNPADGTALLALPRCQAAEAQAAIEAAHRAQLAWRKTTAKHRSGILHRWFELVLEHKEDLATLITLEGGKPLSEARGEVDYAASFLQWFAEEAKRVRGDIIPAPHEKGAAPMMEAAPARCFEQAIS